MTLSAQAAARDLRAAESIGLRVHRSAAYGRAGGQLVMWGAIWVLGYCASGIVPFEKWGLIWLPLLAIGVTGSALQAMRKPRQAWSAKYRGRAVAMFGAVGLFLIVMPLAMRPAGPASYLVLPPLTLGLVYVLLGNGHGMTRFVWIGGVLFVTSSAAYCLVGPSFLPFILGGVGGGSLIAGGIWLRAA